MSAWQPDALLPGFEAPRAPRCRTTTTAPVVGDAGAPARRPGAARRGALRARLQRLLLPAAHGRALQPRRLRVLRARPAQARALAAGRTSIRTSARASPSTTPTSTRAIEAIGAPVLLAGHSTGGLICSLYAHEGARRGEVRGAVAEQRRSSTGARRLAAAVAARRGGDRPLLPVPHTRPERLPPTYTQPAARAMGVRHAAQAGPGLPALLRLDRRHQRRARQGASRPRPGDPRCCPCIPDESRHRARLAAHRALVAHARQPRRGARLPGRLARPRPVAARRSAKRSSASSSPGRNRP